MQRLIILLSMALSLTLSTARAERYYYFTHLQTTDGLPSNTIHGVHQDRSGFIWIGTRDGLCRYDGKEFRRLSDISPTHRMNSATLDITEDVSGKIWFSSTSGIGYYDPNTDQAGMLGGLQNRFARYIQADSRGNVWIVSESLFRYDTSNSGLHAYTFPDTEPSMVSEDRMGNIRVLMKDGTVHIYDRLTDEFERQPIDQRLKIIESTYSNNLLAATTDDKVILLDCLTFSSKEIFSTDGKKEIRCLKEGNKGEFWIGTDMGLFIRREHEAYNGQAYHNNATPSSISADLITSIDKDLSGNIWVGTYYTGLNIWKNKAEEMSLYLRNPSTNSIRGKVVRKISPDNNGKIWFCTEDGWLNNLDPKEQKANRYELIKNLNMHDMIIDGGRIWICSYGQGLFIFDMDSGKSVKRYDLSDNRLSCGLKTRGGEILIGSRGLYRYDETEDSFRKIEALGNRYVHCLYEDKRGMLWIGTSGNGIICLDKEYNVQASIMSGDKGLTSNFITSFFEDSRNRMWVTTEGGGICFTEAGYKIENLKFDCITRESGLLSNVTCAVTEDSDGDIWVSTIQGISYISGNDRKVLGHLNDGNEITGYQYSYGAVCAGTGGLLYFGNTEGMVAFVPAMIKDTDKGHPLYITAIEARSSGAPILLKEPGKSVLTSKEIQVKQKDASNIRIGFVIPDYSSHNTIYSYRVLKGNRELLSGTTDENSVHLTGLRPGKYRFEVGALGRIVNDDTRTLDLTITAHPLRTKVAYLIYIVVILAMIAIIIKQVEAKRKADREKQYNKLVNNKEKEIYNAKINFFTNITHEIRTPLTLIKLPLDKIISSGRYTAESEKDLKTIQANADRLLSLTNQLLDMRKMEQNDMKMSFIREDLCAIVRKAVNLFEQPARDQHIEMSITIPESPLCIMCAKDSVFTIISNLLSNAMKYGDRKINVSVSCKDDTTCVVRVESDGDIIPESDKEKIFEIFFQREKANKDSAGTGLGLPYARNLANMHNGKLYLDCSVTDMNSFVLELPVRQEDEVNIVLPPPTEKAAHRETAEYDNSRHTVLVAEDSEEMRDYLADELSATYNVRTAANGADALEIIKNEKVDLIISDIMMPVMNGCELCKSVKSDSDLSHIPVILLTAAIGTETRIETLEAGADGYIEKPFSMELLRSNIANLFKNKEISYRQFMNKPLTHYSSVTVSKVDQAYMDKVHDFIMKHIAETDLNIENLTLQLGTSKSSLYRKLKANTGLSINEYIRLCRLKQAAELLASQKYKINEVAFMTGFSSPSYFATCFQKQFNITPSDFIKNLGQ